MASTLVSFLFKQELRTKLWWREGRPGPHFLPKMQAQQAIPSPCAGWPAGRAPIPYLIGHVAGSGWQSTEEPDMRALAVSAEPLTTADRRFTRAGCHDDLGHVP